MNTTQSSITAETTWTAQNLLHYPLIEHVALSPNGQQALYTVRRPHYGESGSEFRHTTCLANLQGDPAPRALTNRETAAQPRWSPDGKQIAFLRPTADTDKMGIWVMPAGGGEPWPLTGVANNIRNAVTTFRWSPDGQRIAFLTVPWDDALEARRTVKDDTRRWRVDYNFAHLFVVEARYQPESLPEARALTDGRLHVVAFDWRPDSAEIAFMHRPTPYIDSWPEARLATVSTSTKFTKLSSAELPTLTDRGLLSSRDSALAYSPNGKWIACEVGHEDRQWPYASRIHLFPLGEGASKPLAEVADEQPMLLGWSPDSQFVYAREEVGLSSTIFALPIDGGVAQPLYTPEDLIAATDINKQGHVVFVQENLDRPQALYALDLTAPPPTETVLQPITQPHAPEYPSGPLPQTRILRWQTADGFEIEGVLYLPANHDPKRDGKLPLLLHIHGGPASLFQRQFAGTPYYYTPAALCERGIALLRCNPRGSSGYGKRFRFANVQDWGGGDFRDLMQGVDLVIEEGIADPERLGICGWSYGGFMSSWVITQTDRFVAASIGAPVTNLISFVGTADIPGFIPGYFGGEIWEETALLIERSPLFQAHKGNTPAIIQHGDADERVPLEQGLQYYMALERRNVPVEMFIYPRQGHAITEPYLLADAIQRNLDWFTAKLTTSKA